MNHDILNDTSPVDENPLHVDIEPSDDPDWSYEIWLDEGLEHQLGAARFAELEDSFAAIPGVEVAMFEDRELCFVRVKPNLTSEQLRQEVQALLKN